MNAMCLMTKALVFQQITPIGADELRKDIFVFMRFAVNFWPITAKLIEL
jgi:hypothetical protein